MRGEVDPKVEEARAAYEEAKRQYAEADAAVSAAKAALDGAQEAREESRVVLRKAALLLDDALGLDACEMGRSSMWRRVVITKRTKASVWVREYGCPGAKEIRFALRHGTWTRHGDGSSLYPAYLRGVP